MREPSDSNVKTIENATLDDVQPGDHITWKEARVYHGVTAFERHAGIAHHRDWTGDWCTEEGAWITCGGGKGATLTIRRAVQDLPTASCTVIVPADGREYIEAEVLGETYHASEAILLGGRDWLGAWRSPHGILTDVTSGQIAPGTWKVGNR